MRELLKKFPDIPLGSIGRSSCDDIEDLLQTYKIILPYITKRTKEFRQIYVEGNEKRLFAELAFCLLTPQSNARYCWENIVDLYESNILFVGDENDIANILFRVRFKGKKSKFIVMARELVFNEFGGIRKIMVNFSDIFSAREWFVKNIRGFGYKEASHFLRNLGFGERIAILDRHILRNLMKYGIIDVIPVSLTKKKYYEIEDKFDRFAKEIAVPLEHMDLLFWYYAKGEIFK